MNTYSPQCENVRDLISVQHKGKSEPLFTVLDLPNSHPEAVQVNIRTQDGVRSLTLIGLPREGALASEVREVVIGFLGNPVTCTHHCG